jgi:hypothetical protein
MVVLYFFLLLGQVFAILDFFFALPANLHFFAFSFHLECFDFALHFLFTVVFQFFELPKPLCSFLKL